VEASTNGSDQLTRPLSRLAPPGFDGAELLSYACVQGAKAFYREAALRSCAPPKVLEKVKVQNHDQKVGVDIVRKAIRALRTRMEPFPSEGRRFEVTEAKE
jgi:hypothetical protein